MKKSILFINGHLNTGGVEKSLVDILRHLDPERYDIELLLLEEFGDYAPELPAHVHIRLFDLHNTYGNIVSSLLRCIRAGDWKCAWVRIVFMLMKLFGQDKIRWAAKTVLGTKTYDCVVGFRPGICTELAAYAAKATQRLGWWHHGEINLSEVQLRNYVRTCRNLHKLVTVSNGCRELLEGRCPELTGHITVIPNMLDIDRICKQADAYIPFEKQPGITDFVTVGRLSAEKHVENAVLAAAALQKSGFTSFRWFIVGDGAEQEALAALIKRKSLTDRVFLVGSKANPYPYMASADIFVHPSYVESQGLSVLEAMALGTPCVVTRSIGVEEFVEDNKNAMLATPSAENLTDCVQKVLNCNSGTWNRMREYQRITANRYAPCMVTAKFEQLFWET